MALSNGYWATYWQQSTTNVRDGEIYAQISTSRKVNEEYITDFSGWVSFRKDAAQKMANAQKGDRFKVLNFTVTSSYNKETNTTRYFFTIWDVELQENSAPAPAPTNTQEPLPTANVAPIDDDEDLPF